MPTQPNSNVQGSVGAYAPDQSPQGGAPQSFVDLVDQMRKNFLDKDVEIMPGLTFNQYDTLQLIHFYLNSKFEGGDLDENGSDKFFHNIINHRNAHSTKNIDLDTKDFVVKTKLENKYWASWLLRSDLQSWMREEKFSLNLNQLAEDLPKFGTVVWKKVKYKDEYGKKKVCVKNVDLRDLILDQSVECLRDSQLMAERIPMSTKDVNDKIEYGGWDKEQCELLLQQAGTVQHDRYLKDANVTNTGAYSLTDTLPTFVVYEVWGWVPEKLLPESILDGKSPDETKDRYVMAVFGGIETGAKGRLLFCEEAEPEDFPYKDVHMRKTPGRWLGVGNTELLFPLQIRMNELVNRFFAALRLGSVHLFQTRGTLIQKNLIQDAQDGDIIESKHPIEPLATEIRAFNQYQNEVNMIEGLADRICNTPEVVTGESMPAATPFRLGAQLGTSAAKIFDFVREGCGIFASEVLKGWILEELIEDLTTEHILDLIGSTEDLATFDQAYRQSVLFGEVKTYVLKTGYLPAPEEFEIAERALSDQMKSGERKIKIEEGFYDEDFLEKAQIILDPTGESEDKAAQSETLGNILQIITSNPAILQDPTAKMIIGRLMEGSGASPLKLAGFVAAPTGGMMPGDGSNAASPAMQKFSSNPGDADPIKKGLTMESVAERLAAGAR